MSDFKFEASKEPKVEKSKVPKAPLFSEFMIKKIIFGIGLIVTILVLHWWFTFLMNIAYRGVLSTIVFFIILGVAIKMAPIVYSGIFSKK